MGYGCTFDPAPNADRIYMKKTLHWSERQARSWLLFQIEEDLDRESMATAACLSDFCHESLNTSQSGFYYSSDSLRGPRYFTGIHTCTRVTQIFFFFFLEKLTSPHESYMKLFFIFEKLVLSCSLHNGSDNGAPNQCSGTRKRAPPILTISYASFGGLAQFMSQITIGRWKMDRHLCLT